MGVLLKRTVNLKIHKDNQATVLVVRRDFPRRILRAPQVNLSSLSEVIAESNVDLDYADANDRPADTFTKALPPHKWASVLA